MSLVIATDCSGIEAPIQALKQLKIPYEQEWYCDIDKFARQSAEANYKKPKVVYTDMLSRETSSLPINVLDLYVCGFPCQAFSLAGKRLGTTDPRSGVIPKMLETIEHCKPKIAILENVKGFLNIEKGEPYKNLLDYLKSLDYKVYVDVYNTKDYGIPQNRERVYFVCIRSDISKKDYIKPKKIKMKPFDDILIDKTIKEGEIPNSYHKNLHKLKPHTKVINSRNFYYPIEHTSNTIDTTCKEMWIVKQNRKITNEELLLLQGFPKTFKQVVSDSQLCKQIGNTMSVNVLKVIIKEALKCI
jgi:DNA (cytosine-5)-methyltransferase 1